MTMLVVFPSPVCLDYLLRTAFPPKPSVKRQGEHLSDSAHTDRCCPSGYWDVRTPHCRTVSPRAPHCRTVSPRTPHCRTMHLRGPHSRTVSSRTPHCTKKTEVKI